jgi:UrcA family protein
VKKLSAAVAAITLLAGPAFAGEPSAAGKPASIRVSTADLDLSQASGQEALRARVTKAVAEACNPSGVYYPDLTMDKACAREIAEKANMMMQQLAGQAAAPRLAQR